MAYLDLDCVRRTPDSYKAPNPTPPPKSLGEEFTDSFNDVFVKNFESGIVGNGDSTISNPFDPNAPGLQRSGFNITVGQNGASSGKSGPSLFGTVVNLGKWFFGTGLPIVIRSEPVQTAIKAVTGFVDSAATAVTGFVSSAVKAVPEIASSAAKAITEAASSAWNWVKSWF